MTIASHASQQSSADGDAATTLHREPDRTQPVLGTAGLLLGVVLLCAGLVAETGGRLPFDMPRTWYINRWLWYGFAVACVAGGCYLLKSRRRGGGAWRAARPGVRFRRLVLYTRAGCHLCREAEHILQEHADYLPPINEIDVDSDPQLLQRLGTCVPVVEIDGKIRFRGRVSRALLRRLIEGTPPLDDASTENPGGGAPQNNRSGNSVV